MRDEERHDYIDGLLKDAGEDWRSRLPAPAVVEATWFASPQPSRTWWAVPAAVAAVVVLAGVVAFAPAFGPPPTQTAGGSAVSSAPSPTEHTTTATTAAATEPPINSPAIEFPYDIVREGDVVTMSGQILEWQPTPRLCLWTVSNGVGDVGCVLSHSVAITGIDPREISGSDANGTWITTYVKVVGAWRNSAIDVRATTKDEPARPFPWPPVPCNAPLGGWPGDGSTDTDGDGEPDVSVLDAEAAAARLQLEIERHPALYSGLWSAANTDETGEVVLRAAVVGTVEDPAKVEPALRGMYPYNLCVVRAEYSARDLQQKARELGSQETDWDIEVDASRDRVAVTLPVLDEGAAALLQPHLDMVEIRPLAVKVDASTLPPPSPTATPTTSPSPAPLGTEIVRDGDLVSVSGNIIDWSTEPEICAWLLADYSSIPQPSCMDILSVPVTGAEPRDLPGGEMISALENFNKVWVTDPLRVFGIWRDGVIDYVLSIPAAESRRSPWSTPSSPVPCDPPTGTWPGNPEDIHPLLSRLQAELDRYPDLYGGLWTAIDKNVVGQENLRVIVVGTTGDVRDVEDRLRQIFPANLCVVQVENSSRELEAVAARLQANGAGWFVRVDPLVNRVAVWLPVIDEAATAILAPDLDMLDVVPVAKRMDADPPEDGERICGISASWCDVFVALVREARPEAFASDSIEIVESGCGPGWAGCPFHLPYMVVVVPPECAGGARAFSVLPPWRSTSNPVSDYRHPLQAHVAELLPADCSVQPPT